jgi:hypothetical protein
MFVWAVLTDKETWSDSFGLMNEWRLNIRKWICDGELFEGFDFAMFGIVLTKDQQFNRFVRFWKMLSVVWKFPQFSIQILDKVTVFCQHLNRKRSSAISQVRTVEFTNGYKEERFLFSTISHFSQKNLRFSNLTIISLSDCDKHIFQSLLMFGISFVLVFELPFPPNEMSITIALKHF